MVTDEKIIARLDQLTKKISDILRGKDDILVQNGTVYGACAALILAGKNLCLKIFGTDQTAYADGLNELRLNTDLFSGAVDDNKTTMATLLGILENVRDEISQGLLSNVAAEIQAGIFDDFLDHAEAFLNVGRKNEAGAIAGVVFEDSIRKLTVKNSILEKGRKLDELISDLTKAKVINSLEAKRARVGAHVRTKATHAQWDEFDASAVKEVIEFLRNSLLLRLAT